jgi:soluble lytic murein transglycosylase-like protein
MRHRSNKRKNFFILLMTIKPVILLILLSSIISLNEWRQNAFEAVSEVWLQKTSMYTQNKGKKSLAKAAPLLPFATPAVPSIKPLIEVEMTSKQKNAENRYQPLILEAAYRYKVEPEIIKAIIMAESGFNPKAVSKVGARGLMQLMPRTARSLGVEDSFKPAHNIDAGVRYFKHLLDQFDGEIKLALAAYNAGSYNVRKYGGIPPFKATKFYINKVLKYYEAYRMT